MATRGDLKERSGRSIVEGIKNKLLQLETSGGPVNGLDLLLGQIVPAGRTEND